MLKKFILHLKTIHTELFQAQQGQSIIIVTFAFLGLLAMLGLALDLGLVYIEQVRVGRTTDAATLSSVVELPYEEAAINRAIEYIELNGYQVGGDTEILIRGCMATNLVGNYYEGGTVPIGSTFPVTDTIVGYTYIPAASGAKTTFVVDTGSFQPETGSCQPASQLLGNATKIRVAGRTNVRMNFMQFFGFDIVPVEDSAVAENVTSLDVMVVMDVSGSMGLDTTCADCWRAYDDISGLADEDLPYPTNGYVNPLPFDPNHPKVPRDPPVTGEPLKQSIPESSLCTQPPNFFQKVGDPYKYLVHEAELYSANSSNWDVQARAPGRGVWVLQRGTKNGDHSNRAGDPAKQSSNVCNPGVMGLDIDCTLGGEYPDTICEGPNNPDQAYDCSAYVKAQTFTTYQGADDPFLNGASFDQNCFSGNTFSSNCWNDPTAPNGPGSIPLLEYDFTPQWDGDTYIWIRAQGGGKQAFAWRGWWSDKNRSWLENNWGYQDKVFWQVDDLTIQGNEDTKALGANNKDDWRDNRALYDKWAWIQLGVVNTGPFNAADPDQHTLKIYQGSTGYKIDKIIFTNNPSGSAPAVMLDNDGKGPRSTTGSASREACNVCNPAYGYTVSDTDCSCKWKPWDGASADATNCTSLPAGTTDYSQLNDDLYGGIQPIRSSQEAIKRFATKLNPHFDQLGFVAFTGNVVSDRSKLQCFQYASLEKGDAGECYDTIRFSDPISFTDVMRAIEVQRPQGGTNIAEGLREGLQELGVNAYGSGYVDSSCKGDPNNNDNGKACDRRGAARKVLILLTDGVPSASPNCTGASDYNDFWDNPNTGNDRDFECSMYYAWVAANNNVVVYTIGLGAGVDEDILTGIATGIDPQGDAPDVTMFMNSRGGRYYPAPTPDLLDGIFDQILENIYVRIVG